MKVQISILESAAGARILLNGDPQQEVIVANGDVQEFDVETIEVRELGLVPNDPVNDNPSY